MAHGLLDVIVDGVNLTARIGPGQALALLAELGHAVASLNSGRRDRATLQAYADDEPWELGLEPDGADVLVTVYRSGSRPQVAIFERRVTLTALHEGVLEAMARVAGARCPPGVAASLSAAGRALRSSWPPVKRAKSARVAVRVAPSAVQGIRFAAQGQFRRRRSTRRITGIGVDAQVERADLHGLLMRAEFEFTVRDKTVRLGTLHPFLFADQLLALASEVLESWQQGRPIFRRVLAGDVRIGVRRGPGDGPMSVTVSAPQLRTDGRGLTFPSIAPLGFVDCVARFARELADAFVDNEPSQVRNLRLSAARDHAEALAERLRDALSDDSVTNPEPDNYRSYLPPLPKENGAGKWSHGGKMRFVPRWVATVPKIDLAATFLCGDRLVVGSARETACILRSTGQMSWRLATRQAACVVTPAGLARIHPEGRVALHDIETGQIRFTTRVAPRVGGGATGAVVHTPGLPKLLVLAESDRQITAIDLVSGDVLWRHTARRPGAYRIRRAGKLLLIAGGDSALVALNAATGEVVWRLRSRLPFWSNIAVNHDAALAIGGPARAPGKLHYLDLWSGQLRWTADLEERHVPGQPPLVTPDAVVVPSRDRRGVGTRAFDRNSGALLWAHAPGLASPTTAWMAVDDAVVANSAAGALISIDALSGIPRFSHVFARHVDADQPRRLEPVLRNGALFVPQHQVQVVRPRDGEIIGTVPTDLIPDLLRVDERCDVYVAEESGHLAAFGVAPRLTLVT